MQPLPPISFAALILGAGVSARMGQPKLLLPWQGSTVIASQLQTWQLLNAARIGVILRPDDAALNAELNRLSFPIAQRIPNPAAGEGMFSSVLCGAKWAATLPDITHWAVILGDQPHLSTEVLRALIKRAAQNPSAICQLKCGEKTGHPVILPCSIIQQLARAEANGTLKDFLKLTDAPRVQLEVSDADLLLDLDTPEDYKRLTANYELTKTH